MRRYEEYVQKMQRISDVSRAIAVLHWDKETYLPKGASHFRSQQISTLSSIAHEMFTEDSTGLLLEALLRSPGLDPDQHRNVELTLRDYRKEIVLSTEFVRRLSMAQAEAFSAWVRAREENAFEVFAPALAHLLDLKREEAALRGDGTTSYDALLDVYEPGLTTAMLDALFTRVKAELIPLIRHITASEQADTAFLRQRFPYDRQWDYGMRLLSDMGFDFHYGRQDISVHPFTISFSPQDVRVTTRIDEHDFCNMLWSCVHECGHALYEQGLPVQHYGLPLGSPASLAMHESQSRLWENHVSRSHAFWQYQLPRLEEFFPEQIEGVSVDQFYDAINVIAPNLIRTEADELHYHLHVLIRYELESALIAGTLDVSNLKDAWNMKYRDYLGLEVPDDRTGILQDVHWSHGGFGYFPTYSLGSFYAAQLFAQMNRDIPGIGEEIGVGRFTSLRAWLAEVLYGEGRRYEPADLMMKITGKQPGPEDFLDYVKAKYG